ncbi:hypothetical protein, partial [Aeromonas caviae]|uniref:hypothetical protein n=1 Tax=Aeromonas caviae TaxID=648 RepID=UPI002B462905
MIELARVSRTTYGAVDESVSGISLPEDARPGMMVVLVMTALARVSRTTYGSVDESVSGISLPEDARPGM